MRYLLDTGILLRLAHRTDPAHELVRDALRALRDGGHRFVTTRQNMAEFWNVCTRPAEARGGFGLSLEETARRLRLVELVVTVLREPPTAFERWKKLLVKHRVRGVQAHDARIVAVMIAHRVRRLLTINDRDFVRFNEIDVITPVTVR